MIFLKTPTNNIYELKENSQAIDAGTNLVSPIVINDIVNADRPNGTAYDIGAYEYPTIASGTHIFTEENNITVYHNPFMDKVILDGDFNNYEIKIFNAMGQMVADHSGASSPLTIDLNMLGAGMYFIAVENAVHQPLSVYKIIKQ